MLPPPQMILLVLARRHPRNINDMYRRYAPLDIAQEVLRPHMRTLLDNGWIEMFGAAGMCSLTDAGVEKQAEIDPYIEWDDNENDQRRLRFRAIP